MIAVIAALGVSVWQSRAATTQSAAATAAVRQNSSQETLRHSVDFLYLALRDDPELLAWFLHTRGFPPGTAEVNKRYLLLFVRLDIHDAVYSAHRNGISEELWHEWLPSMRLDFESPEGQVVWATTRHLFSPAFGEQVGQVLHELQEKQRAAKPETSNR